MQLKKDDAHKQSQVMRKGKPIDKLIISFQVNLPVNLLAKQEA